MKRLQQLDALRGLAAMAVVLYHYTWWYQIDVRRHPPGLIAVFRHGLHGIDLFFIISGFVILMTLERSRSLADFAVSRFARLYPAFLAGSCVALSVIVLARFNPNGITPAKALLSLTMLSPLAKWPSLDLSYWTLTYEVLFYIAAGTVFLGFGIRRVEWPCIAWLALSFAGRLAGLAGRNHRSDVLFDFSFANLFVAGMMIFRIASGRASRLTYLTLVLAVAVMVLRTDEIASQPAEFGYALLVCGFSAVVYAAAKGWLRALEWAPLLFLGEISYALYLVHQQLGFWIIQRLEAAGTNPNLAILGAIVVAIVVATAIRKLVERPAQSVIRHWYAAWVARRPLAPLAG